MKKSLLFALNITMLLVPYNCGKQWLLLVLGDNGFFHNDSLSHRALHSQQYIHIHLAQNVDNAEGSWCPFPQMVEGHTLGDIHCSATIHKLGLWFTQKIRGSNLNLYLRLISFMHNNFLATSSSFARVIESRNCLLCVTTRLGLHES